MPRLNLKPTLESLPCLFAFCEEQGVDSRTMLALEEAFVNVAAYSGASRAALSCERRGKGWEFVLEDDGAEFDPTAFVPSSPGSAEEPVAGGQGIRLIRSIMDSVSYLRAGDKNILTLTTDEKQ